MAEYTDKATGTKVTVVKAEAVPGAILVEGRGFPDHPTPDDYYMIPDLGIPCIAKGSNVICEVARGTLVKALTDTELVKQYAPKKLIAGAGVTPR